MSAVDGQLGFDGSEQVDPRITKAAKSLWYRDAKRTWAIDGNDVAKERAIALWPRVEKHYVDAARVALEAAGVL
jgi:hypothetical protein